MNSIEQQLSDKINSMTQLQRCKMEYKLSGNKPEYLRGYAEAIDKACEWLLNTVHIAIDVPTVEEGQKVVIIESYLKEEFVKSFRNALEL